MFFTVLLFPVCLLFFNIVTKQRVKSVENVYYGVIDEANMGVVLWGML